MKGKQRQLKILNALFTIEVFHYVTFWLFCGRLGCNQNWIFTSAVLVEYVISIQISTLLYF